MSVFEMPRLLLTGGTGTLGSQILKGVASFQNDIFCLVRNPNAPDALELKRNSLHNHGRISLMRGDVRQSMAGVSEEYTTELTGQIDCIVHCAASLEFKDAAKANSTNVEGVRNVLALASKLGVKRFCHVSTAYVAGDAAHFTEADLDAGQKWRNAYEASKHAGELLVRAWASQGDRCYTIFRPSILLASHEGPLPAFDAYYAFARPLALAAARFRARASASGPLPNGVTVSDDVVRLPLHLPAKSAATLNLVPVGWAAETIVKLLQRPSTDRTYQLVHPDPPTVLDILRHTMRALRIEGIVIDDTHEGSSTQMEASHSGLSSLQEMLEWSLAAYAPYLNGEPVFSDANVREDLGDKFIAPPAINFDFLHRTLEHAEESRWQSVRRGVGGHEGHAGSR